METANKEEPPQAVAELIQWLNSSLCQCSLEKVLEENDGRLDETILEKMWTDGRVFQWLVHSFKPDAISHPRAELDLSEEDLRNIQLAFKTSQEEFGVQNLLLPGDFAKNKDAQGRADSLVLATYLAQLKYALKNAEPVCTNKSPMKLNWQRVLATESFHLRPPSESPTCHDCQKEVYILERLLVAPTDKQDNETFARHRRCFCCERCKKLLRIGLYRPTASGLGYECLDHEKEDLIKAATAAETKGKAVEVEVEEKMYPDLPAPEQTPLYPTLKIPEKSHDASTDSGVSSSITDVGTTAIAVEKSIDQLAPPVPTRCRSSERAVPVAAPRKSLHSRGGSDATAPTSDETSQKSTALDKPPARPSRPSLPPERKSPAVQLRHNYPEEMNPFADTESPAYRHSTPSPKMETVKSDPRRSVSPAVTGQHSASKASADQSDNHGDSLNPFGSDSDSETEEKHDGNEDTSSLSSTNPFNESDEECDKKAEQSDVSKANPKKVPPPRPPPPTTKSVGASAAPPKQVVKKRHAPAPPPQPTSPVKVSPPPRPASPPKKQHKKKRQAPPRPLPLKRQIRTQSNLSPEQLLVAFEENEKNLLAVESESGAFELKLRQNLDENGVGKVSDDVMGQWIEFIHQKFDLVRKETELVYIYRERHLDELHAELEYQLRCLIEKPESEHDVDREASLLQRMLDIIEEKSKLVDSQDEMIAQRGGSLPRGSNFLDDSSLSSGSKNSTLEKNRVPEDKQAKKKKKIKLRLKKLKQKIANSSLLHHT